MALDMMSAVVIVIEREWTIRILSGRRPGQDCARPCWRLPVGWPSCKKELEMSKTLNRLA